MSANTPSSPLLPLPTELCNTIYAYAASTGEFTLEGPYFAEHPAELALAATCHQIRAEYLPILRSTLLDNATIINFKLDEFDTTKMSQWTRLESTPNCPMQWPCCCTSIAVTSLISKLRTARGMPSYDVPSFRYQYIKASSWVRQRK